MTSMPKAVPAYIRHCAKHHSTESLISPKGGAMNPATLSPTPEASIAIAVYARTFLIIVHLLSKRENESPRRGFV